MNAEFVSQTPNWYILLCLILGISLAVFYYYKSKIFSKNQKLILSLLRGVLAFLVSFLLLNPLIKSVSSLLIKPKVAILIDNSKSISKAGNFKELSKGIAALETELHKKDFETVVLDIQNQPIDKLENVALTGRKTNLAAALSQLKTNYEGQNLSDVVLISDGIINDGVSPTFAKHPFNVHTVGFGDTTIKKDAFISGVAANRIAYLGNNFMVAVDVSSYLLQGQTANLSIKTGEGTILSTQKVAYNNNETFGTYHFELPAKAIGKQRFIVDLQVLNGEHSTANNRREFVVDVVNGKEKILLLAYAPHPDLKAFKSIIDKNEYFELDIKIITQTDVNMLRNAVYDVLILHHLPDVENLHSSFLPALLARQKPTFFIVGNKTHLSYFNGMQNIVSINSMNNRLDKVTTQINPAFSLFNVSESQNKVISDLPPVNVPFGTYSTLPGSDVILGQYVSGINSGRPLLAVNLTGSRKMAVLIAEGFWQWRMEEYASTQSNFQLDDLILKTLQLIAVKEDKGKLRVYPVSDVFNVDQRISFVAEVYNDLYERIYDKLIELKIKGPGVNKAYEFKITENSSRFDLANLPVGVYNYEAKVQGKTEIVNGQFVVSDTDVELQNTQADFNLLKTLSSENNGQFVEAKNIFELRNAFTHAESVNKIVAQEDLKELINWRILLGIILLIASLEWVLRKYFGSY